MLEDSQRRKPLSDLPGDCSEQPHLNALCDGSSLLGRGSPFPCGVALPDKD